MDISQEELKSILFYLLIYFAARENKMLKKWNFLVQKDLHSSLQHQATVI